MNPEQQNLIEALYIRFYSYLHSFALRLLNDEYLAEDAVHEAFRIACLRAEVLISCGNIEGWMVNTLKNVIFDIWRKQKKMYKVFEMQCRMNKFFTLIDYDRLIVNLYYHDMLNPEEYKLIEYSVFEGYTINEIAVFLGVSNEACKKRFQRTKKKLISRIIEIDE